MGRVKFNGDQIAIELHDGTTNTAIKENWDVIFPPVHYYKYWTKDFWKIDLQAGRILQLTDGTRIEFNHQGDENWWYATKITKNGNQILINYVSGTRNILNIIDTLGRKIDFAYAKNSNITRLTAISCATDPNLNVQYQYPPNGQYPSVIMQVIYPGNEVWKYSYLYNAVHSVSTPYGGTITYTYDNFSRFSPGPGVKFYQISISKKETSGTGIKNGTWDYNYGGVRGTVYRMEDGTRHPR